MDNIYKNSPVFLQNIACSLYGYKIKTQRFGDCFHKSLNWLEESQWWSKTDIKSYQNKKLRNIISYAYEKVPYYHDLFNHKNLKPDDIKSINDLHKIPLLTKEIVRNNWKKMISSDYKIRNLIKTHTSGSTGKPLEFYLTSEALQFQWAVWWRFRKRFGINFGDLHCNFTGKIVVPLKQKKPPFWRYNKPLNQYLINMHHIVPQNIKSIVNFLNSKKFKFYSGYPSIIYILCTLIEEANLRITSPPEIVFTGAENLLEHHKKKIHKVLGCIVTDQYGFSEGCGNTSRCKYNLFHEDFEFGTLECLTDDNFRKSKKNEKTGKIVATGFVNYAMPFIRYDIGDVATWIYTQCKCGRKSETIKYINGRDEDYVLTPEGRKIRRFSHVFKEIKNIKEAQILQKQLGEIIVKIVKRENYCIKNENKVRSEIARWISPKLNVKFRYVNDIKRNSSGKFKAVKSLLEDSK